MKRLNDCRILLVDDTKANIDLLVEALQGEYKLSVALNGEAALKAVEKRPPDLLLLDVMMPGMDGYEVCRRLQADPITRGIPVMFLTAMDDISNKTEGFEAGGVDYITKPFEIAEIKMRVRTHLDLKLTKEGLQEQNLYLEQKVRERSREIIIRLAMAAELRDTDTGMHIVRIREYVKLVALKAGQSQEAAERMGLASTMHDIGKIGIPDRILLKPGKLDVDEWRIMKTHAQIGAQIMSNSHSKLLDAGRIIAHSHHEKWDGTGYPMGLGNSEIPLEGRICCLADVFDALTSKRPYKEPWEPERALEVMIKDRATHFDPDLIDVFKAHFDDVLAIHNRHTDDNEFSQHLIQELIAY